LTQNTTCKHEYLGRGLTRPNNVSQEKNIQGTFREHSGNIQGTFREHSGIPALFFLAAFPLLLLLVLSLYLFVLLLLLLLLLALPFVDATLSVIRDV
jgi:cellulose synthase/poly-beta-1,6-N-acetylglucosamine synthase-like glycosyltransferase